MKPLDRKMKNNGSRRPGRYFCPRRPGAELAKESFLEWPFPQIETWKEWNRQDRKMKNNRSRPRVGQFPLIYALFRGIYV